MSLSETFEEIFRKRFGRAPTQEETNRVIDQSVTSHNQSGGITAHTVNIGPQSRKMEESLKHQILSIDKAIPIHIFAPLGDTEAIQFANEIREFFVSNGYPMVEENGITQEIRHPPVQGLEFNPSTGEFRVGANPG